jgi:hypothetical protein
MSIELTPKILARLKIHRYDVKIYRPDGREGPTVRGLTRGQAHVLVEGLNLWTIKSLTKEIL